MPALLTPQARPQSRAEASAVAALDRSVARWQRRVGVLLGQERAEGQAGLDCVLAVKDRAVKVGVLGHVVPGMVAVEVEGDCGQRHSAAVPQRVVRARSTTVVAGSHCHRRLRAHGFPALHPSDLTAQKGGSRLPTDVHTCECTRLMINLGDYARALPDPRRATHRTD